MRWRTVVCTEDIRRHAKTRKVDGRVWARVEAMPYSCVKLMILFVFVDFMNYKSTLKDVRREYSYFVGICIEMWAVCSFGNPVAISGRRDLLQHFRAC